MEEFDTHTKGYKATEEDGMKCSSGHVMQFLSGEIDKKVMHYPSFGCDGKYKYKDCLPGDKKSSEGVFHCTICSYDICY